MREEEWQQIESELRRELPAELRDALLNFPQTLIDQATICDDEGNEFVDSMMLTPNAEYLIAVNQGREDGWPEQYFVVGDNGCGEEFSVDVSSDVCPVYVSGPHNDAMANGPTEEGYFEQICDNLQAWVRHLASQGN